MAVVFAVLVVVSLAIPLLLWLAISRETSNPTVVDRAEAERIAKAQGGRDPSRSAGDSPAHVADGDHTTADSDDGRRPDERDEWGTRRS